MKIRLLFESICGSDLPNTIFNC